MTMHCGPRVILIGLLAAQFLLAPHAMAIQGERVPGSDSVANSIVLILVENRHTCSGVVFGKDKILTAAHCVIHFGKKKFKPESVKVYYTRNLYADAHSVGIVSRILTHPKYVAQKRDRTGHAPVTTDGADIAVLWLKAPHPDRAKEVTLSGPAEDYTSSIYSQTSGANVPSVVAYGFGPETKKFNGVLKKARMAVDNFFGSVGWAGTQRLVAVQRKSNQRVGVCSGDSGGGVFYLNSKTGEVLKRRGSPILAGIIFAKTGLGRCANEERMLKTDSFELDRL